MSPKMMSYGRPIEQTQFTEPHPYNAHFWERALYYGVDDEYIPNKIPGTFFGFDFGIEYFILKVTPEEAERFQLQAGSFVCVREGRHYEVTVRAGFASQQAAERWADEHPYTPIYREEGQS